MCSSCLFIVQVNKQLAVLITINPNQYVVLNMVLNLVCYSLFLNYNDLVLFLWYKLFNLTMNLNLINKTNSLDVLR